MNDKKLSWEAAVAWLREQPDKKELVENCYFDDPIEAAAARYYQSEEWHAVMQLLAFHLPGRVLDIGAGRGISTVAFARIGCNVYAVEPDASNLVGRGAISQLLSMAENMPTPSLAISMP